MAMHATARRAATMHAAMLGNRPHENSSKPAMHHKMNQRGLRPSVASVAGR